MVYMQGIASFQAFALSRS